MSSGYRPIVSDAFGLSLSLSLSLSLASGHARLCQFQSCITTRLVSQVTSAAELHTPPNRDTELTLELAGRAARDALSSLPSQTDTQRGRGTQPSRAGPPRQPCSTRSQTPHPPAPHAVVCLNPLSLSHTHKWYKMRPGAGPPGARYHRAGAPRPASALLVPHPRTHMALHAALASTVPGAAAAGRQATLPDWPVFLTRCISILSKVSKSRPPPPPPPLCWPPPPPVTP